MIVEHRVSGHDFVRAMLLAGYRLVGTSMGQALLAKGDLEVGVPQRDQLADDVIRSLLQQVNMPQSHLVTLLNRLASRDTWPEQGEILPDVNLAPSRAP